MSTSINSRTKVMPYRKVSSTEVTPIVASKDMSTYTYNNSLSSSNNVKNALDELFSMTTEPPFNSTSWQKFTASGEFIVPEGINKILILCISPGGVGTCSGSSPNFTSNPGFGGPLASAFLTVTPGSKYTITTGSSTSVGKSSISDELGEEILYCSADTSNTFIRGILKDSLVVSKVAAKGTAGNSLYGGRGGGGFAVSYSSDEEERLAWLDIALNGLELEPAGYVCRPDTTKFAVENTNNAGGRGADYGGGGGGVRLGYTSYRGVGGSGMVAIFY